MRSDRERKMFSRISYFSSRVCAGSLALSGLFGGSFGPSSVGASVSSSVGASVSSSVRSLGGFFRGSFSGSLGQFLSGSSALGNRLSRGSVGSLLSVQAARDRAIVRARQRAHRMLSEFHFLSITLHGFTMGESSMPYILPPSALKKSSPKLDLWWHIREQSMNKFFSEPGDGIFL